MSRSMVRSSLLLRGQNQPGGERQVGGSRGGRRVGGVVVGNKGLAVGGSNIAVCRSRDPRADWRVFFHLFRSFILP